MEEYYFHLIMSDYVFSIASLVIGIVFLITRGPKAARLGIVVAGVMLFVLAVGFGFFWPYKITLSGEGVSTHTFFNTETIKYVEIIEIISTRNATRGGKLRDNYAYTIKAKDRKVSFDQNSFPREHKLIVSKIVHRAKLKLISTQESGIVYQIWRRNNR